jgi:hypothetical protein
MNIVMSRSNLSPALRRIAIVGFSAAVFFTGCLGRARPRPETVAAGPTPPQLGSAGARIASLNPEYGFVVIDFKSRTLPAVGTRVTIYRNGKRVGVVRITEPVRAQLATADIVEGDMHVGDEAR